MNDNQNSELDLKLNGEYVHDFNIKFLRELNYLTKEQVTIRILNLLEFIQKYPDELDHSLEPKSDVHNYLIEDVKYGVGAGGMACGPVSGPTIATVRYNDGEKSQYLNCSEFDGFLYFFLTDKDVFNYLMEEEEATDEMNKYLDDTRIWHFEDIDLDDSESLIYQNIKESEDYNAGKFIRYMLSLIDLSYEATKALVERSKGKHISDFYVSRTENEVWYEKEDYEE